MFNVLPGQQAALLGAGIGRLQSLGAAQSAYYQELGLVRSMPIKYSEVDLVIFEMQADVSEHLKDWKA